MVNFYGRDGAMIKTSVFGRLCEDDAYRRIGLTELALGDEKVTVSTVWSGINHNVLGDGPPVIFETMVFGGPHDHEITRYTSEAAAREGHLRTVADLRAEEDAAVWVGVFRDEQI